LRIGLDFDNTIADYDQAFPRVARLLGVVTGAESKQSLRDELTTSPEGERTWQRIQGLVYGRYINEAQPHSGVAEFVRRARCLGHELFIISHKSEFGHFDESRTPLREAAMTWLLKNQIVGESTLSIRPSHVYFAATRSDKLSTIKALEIDVFVDDLLEVLTESGFPSIARRVWFVPRAVAEEQNFRSFAEQPQVDGADTPISRASSWKQFANELFGTITADESRALLESEWPDLQVSEVSRVAGRGNSQIFRVDYKEGIAALKMYPDLVPDKRPRRATEWHALQLLATRGFSVPRPIATSARLNWSLLAWLPGDAPAPDDAAALSHVLSFVKSLKELSREQPDGHDLASESCLRPIDIATQIDERIRRLQSTDQSELTDFLKGNLLRERDRRATEAQELLGNRWAVSIPGGHQILSPSDFGFHNAFKSADGQVTFFDFEYFGWDDPVKLIADFAIHPGSNIEPKLQQLWIESACTMFSDDDNFATRLSACLPLYALRWVLILLNEFRPDVARKRVLAQSILEAELPRIQGVQLEKARQMIKKTFPKVPGASELKK
jgi:hypothetical protein